MATFERSQLVNDMTDQLTIDLSKQQSLDAAPKTLQQINFTATLERDGSTTMFSLLKKRKKPF